MAVEWLSEDKAIKPDTCKQKDEPTIEKDAYEPTIKNLSRIPFIEGVSEEFRRMVGWWT